ncbi:hypothetical protein [Kaistella faecalis]|uniref:hypothetical protein n=1 Tax=Kaistella faecalis TaxID=2852098 RepID=UPI001C4541A5|nr:hypothetical protein [Chryseobacterium faecale]UFK96968.1 hypothetical protein LL667_08270 [Chryseobacterium faecale]
MIDILNNFDNEITDIYKAYRMSHFSLYLMENKFYEYKEFNPQIANFLIQESDTGEEIRFTEEEVNKNSENGLYQRIIAGNTIAMFYNLWEDKYRKLIADELKVEKGDILVDFFGDLRLIRASITHNNYNAISDLKKLKVITFMYDGCLLKLTSFEVEKLYNELRIQIRKFDKLGLESFPPRPKSH